jgi:hypothetical protein
MSEFRLPDVKFVPEVDEIPITLAKFKSVIEWANHYNLQSKLGKNDHDGDAIPTRYIGRNRYWISESVGHDETVGDYALFSVYDLDPRAPDGRVLLVRYRLTDARGDLVQTQAQAAKHIQACRLEVERQEAMEKKDPKLNQTVNIHMPAIYKPAKAQAKALETLNGSD